MNFHEYEKVRTLLVERIDVEAGSYSSKEEAYAIIEHHLSHLLDKENIIVTRRNIEKLTKTYFDDIFGLGPLQDLLNDPTVNDIMVNGTSSLYVERAGRLTQVELPFSTNDQIMRIAQRIVAPIGRRVDESSPMVDARLADGSRVNIIIPPVALDGCTISIRKFKEDKLDLVELVRFGSMTPEMAHYLSLMVRAKANIIISGGTGSGKTTLLNAISNEIEDGDRIVTIEDAAELQIQKAHVVRLESRPKGLDGGGQVSIRDLVINSLRMRPDRIIIGECRGEEAFEMLQAMNTGHEGSFSTIHANTPKDALVRLESMLSMANPNIPTHTLKGQISQAVDIIVQCARLSSGERKITNICEIGGIEGNVIQSQDVFVLNSSKTAEGIMDYAHQKVISYSLLDRKAAFCGLQRELKELLND
ncbi:pilus assembly protein CpaF [Serratia fonticola]|jgi:pilus assembly protein CpaF|uniref:Pilus assembly protein CpaF n=1 Tax=Serratia fonticola TaxID=47917 RepID=A0A542CVJ9_SERFO|nr:CpaF family protein [Serratia fonticola]TQI78172.1 pilus assembly protein CpaF [Serratia fonticola]TQI94830.1 pilus assembly protein CpaF [Serratia fonticola]TVZ69328.1 pilus assembly protein CpaF [Serratia fonticola]